MSNRSVGRLVADLLKNQPFQHSHKRKTETSQGNGTYNKVNENRISSRKKHFVELVNGNWHSQEESHHRKERWYWLGGFVATVVVAFAAIVSADFAIRAWRTSKDTLKEAQKATTAAQTQAEYAKTSFEASTRASIVTFGIEWADPPEQGKSGFVYILFGNNGKDPTSVIANPSYAFGPHQQKFGFGDADVGPNTSCNKLAPVSNGVTALPLSGSTYKVPFEIPVVAMDIGLSDGYSIVVRGCFAYKDLGRVFHTPFCYIAAQKGAIATQALSPLCSNAQAEPD